LLLPHRLTVITPVGVVDEYGNPVLRLDYGPGAARRTIPGLMQPTGSTSNPEPGRTAIVTTWRLFTTAPITARDRILWQDKVFQVTGEPSWWSPRFGHTHCEANLTHVEG
jgi:hypothetical protein